MVGPVCRCGWLSKKSGDRWRSPQWYVLDQTKVRRLCDPRHPPDSRAAFSHLTHNACAEPPRSPKPAVPSQLCYWTQKPTVDTLSSFCDGVDLFFDATSSAGRSVTRSVDDARGTSYCAFEVHGTDGLGHGATLTFRCSAVSEAQEWIHCIAINIEAHQARGATFTAAAAAPPPESTAALAEAPAAYLEGFLYKTGALNKCWKRRWVTLHWDITIPLQCLMYHRVHKAAVAKGGAEGGSSLGGSSQLKPPQLKPAGVLLLPECSLSFPPADKAQGVRMHSAPALGQLHTPSTSPARAQHEPSTSSAPAQHQPSTSPAPALHRLHTSSAPLRRRAHALLRRARAHARLRLRRRQRCGAPALEQHAQPPHPDGGSPSP